MQIHVNLGSKVPAGIDVTVDMANIAAVNYLVEYGLKQSLNDAIAAVKTSASDYSPESTLAIVQKKLDAIMSGTVRQAGTREASDPLSAILNVLANDWWKAMDGQKKKAALTKIMQGHGIDEKSAKAAMMKAYRDNPATRARAEEIKAKPAPEIDIDLSELGL